MVVVSTIMAGAPNFMSVDAQTYLVSKMQRVNPQLGNLDYVFADYKKNNGVTYASSINFFIAGVPNIISTRHELSFNNEVPANSFDIPEDFSAEAERIDTSEMLVNKISDRVYHIGQNNAFSIFVDTGMGVVSAGGYPGINGRFERYQKESENFKPLAFQIVTHHHSDLLWDFLSSCFSSILVFRFLKQHRF